MAARTKARKRAVDILFEADQRGDNVLVTLEARLSVSSNEAPAPEYTSVLVRGVAERWADIEAALGKASANRPVSRMPAVDRAIARVAAWEVLFAEDVPAAVAISEAVDLAASLSTDESPAYLNGVLGAIARGDGAATDLPVPGASVADALDGAAVEPQGDDAPVE